MPRVTVTIQISDESAAFMEKCIGEAQGSERDAFFEAAIASLAEKLLELDAVTPHEAEEPHEVN